MIILSFIAISSCMGERRGDFISFGMRGHYGRGMQIWAVCFAARVPISWKLLAITARY